MKNDGPLKRQLEAKIKSTGPITVAEYMRESLLNPFAGYYTSKGQEILGAKGDFTTAPEVSQMFGELIGVWAVHEWMKLGGGFGDMTKLQIVELGPGYGTLMRDVLRVMQQFKTRVPSVSVHLVERSSSMVKKQQEMLRQFSQNTEVIWHEQLESVPEGFSFFIAQEFFDALPVHVLRGAHDGPREILVDITEDPSALYNFRFVLANGPTPATVLFHSLGRSLRLGENVEFSPESERLAEMLATRIDLHGGFGLIFDYGSNARDARADGDTLRAFYKHTILHPLSLPGEVDLTADVNFEVLKQRMEERALVFGPVTQDQYIDSDKVSGTWTWLFILSKVPELGDTIFIVLRKQPLIFLHWYHHVTVLLYCWYSFAEVISNGRWFITMNYTVHAIMYRVLDAGSPCQITNANIRVSLMMYFSYFLLFAQFFYNSYVKPPGQRRRQKELSPVTTTEDSCHSIPSSASKMAVSKKQD
ncbi:unnamed protein product [Cyprideis torosa]|uniref:Protein arginine methyltransferase NDUFAF7 n=1 Tax=Cyprideis torosa TaxID=163714 RepID=A0A7R8WF67_9CRUS|nr:unnamed protein product [Cyprideis torosa]CAG0895138.1 unnamed protein product [Cyprideis torosa]